ncbi:uncharacterized protein CCOS01_17099, partial [Colletotrichum costaricense]
EASLGWLTASQIWLPANDLNTVCCLWYQPVSTLHRHSKFIAIWAQSCEVVQTVQCRQQVHLCTASPPRRQALPTTRPSVTSGEGID